MRKLQGSWLLASALLVLLPVLHVSALLPCPSQQTGRDTIRINIMPEGSCILQPQGALPGHAEPDTKLLLTGTPFTASRGASSAIIQTEQPPVFEELAGTLIEATVRDVQLVVPAASWPEQGATLQQLLLQPLFGQAVPQGLQLINVMLLYEATDMQQAAAVLDAAVSDSSIRQRVADWSLDLYTDNSSFAYVSGELGGAQLTGVGIFVQPAAATAVSAPAKTAAAAVGGMNYLLGITNSSFIAALETYAGIDTPVPFFMLLATNISWGQQLPESADMLEINRHLILAGQGGSLTGIDFANKVNQVALTGQWSNTTFDGLSLENQGLGNSLSAQSGAPGLSLVASINMWFFYWDRNTARLSTNNCTLVVASQREVEFLQYWGFAFSAHDRDIRGQAGWLASGVGTTVWEADVIGNNTLAHKVVNRVVTNQDSLVTSKHLVFPRIAATISLDPSAYGAALEVQAGSPLVSVVNTNASLQLALSTLDRVVRGGLLLITAPSLSVLHENGTNPLADRYRAFYILNNITYLGSDLCRNTAADHCNSAAHAHRDQLCSSQLNASTARSLPQADLLSKVTGADQPPAGTWPCNASIAADPRILNLGSAPILDFEHVIDFIHLESEPLDSDKSCASFRDLTLRGLPQGKAVPGSLKGRNSSIHWHPTHGLGRRQLLAPSAAAAAAAGVSSSGSRGWFRRRLQSYSGGPIGVRTLTQGTPDVWTILVWSVTRDRANYVNITSVQLLLPQPEYDALLSALGQSGGRPSDIHVDFDDGTSMALKAARTLGEFCIHVSSFEGPGITGSNLLLLPDPNQRDAMSATYTWPAEGSTLQVGPSQQDRGALSPAATAGIVLSAVAVLALVVVAGLFVVRHFRANARAGSSGALHADKNGSYDALSRGSAFAADGENSDKGSSGRPDQSAVPGSVGSGGSSSQRASSNLPLLTPDQLLMISDQAPVSVQGGIQGGPGFDIVPDWGGGSSGNADVVIEPVYEPVYGMYEALHGRSGDAGPQASTRGQRLTAAISDQVRSIHHSRLTSSMQVKEHAGSGRSRRGSSRLTAGAGSGAGSASMGAGSSSAGGDAAAAAGDARSAAGDDGDVDDVSTDLVLHEVIGQGGFGVVYRGTWHGANVAVKSIKLPPGSKLAAVAERRSGSMQQGAVLWEDPASAYSVQQRKQQLTNPAEEMAVQEAAIGSSMCHPNLVAVYSISLHPAFKPHSQAGVTSSNPDLIPWEMQIIQEYCDQGTLRDALNAHLLTDRSTGTNHKPTVLALALHVACAMQYLHKNQVLHSDLKASNVLLKLNMSATSSSGRRTSCASSSSEGSSCGSGSSGGSEEAADSRGVRSAGVARSRSSRLSLIQHGHLIGKVSDFGLSTVLDPGATHMTKACGTPTHMAPELLMHGRCSRASDVYAYGILLWELATNSKPFADVPQPLLGHCVINNHLRPIWPPQLKANPEWQGLLQLADLCWCHDPHMRPTFTEIVAELQRLVRSEPPSAALGERLQRAIAERAVECQEAAAAVGVGSIGRDTSKSQSKKLEGLYGKWSLSWRRVFKPGDEKAGAASGGSPAGSPNNSSSGGGDAGCGVIGSASSNSAGVGANLSLSGCSGLVDADVAAAAAAAVPAANQPAAVVRKPSWMK